jgi:Ni,Fe-hydrogenase I cytochrome b subunit
MKENSDNNSLWDYYVNTMVKGKWGSRDEVATYTVLALCMWFAIILFVIGSIFPAIRVYIIITCSCLFLFSPAIVFAIVRHDYKRTRRNEYFDEGE